MGCFVFVLRTDHGDLVCGQIVDWRDPSRKHWWGVLMCRCASSVVVWVCLGYSLGLAWTGVGIDAQQGYWRFIGLVVYVGWLGRGPVQSLYLITSSLCFVLGQFVSRLDLVWLDVWSLCLLWLQD